MSDSKKAPVKKEETVEEPASKEASGGQSPTPTRFERNLDAEIEPKKHDGGGSTEADTTDGSVTSDSNPIVTKDGVASEKGRKLAKPTRSVATEDNVERNIERDNDSTTHTLDHKIEVTNEALESKREPRSVKYGEPEGKIIREGEKVSIPSEENEYGQQIATEDVWQEQTYGGSARPSYSQLAVKGVPVYPYATVTTVV